MKNYLWYGFGFLTASVLAVAIFFLAVEGRSLYAKKMLDYGQKFHTAIDNKDPVAIEKELPEYEKTCRMPYDAGKLVYVYGSLADIYSKKGEPEKAKDYYLKAINIGEQNPEYVNAKIAFAIKLYFANFLDEKNESMEAEKYTRQAYDDAVKAKDTESQLQAIKDLGITLSNENKFQEAEDKKLEAIKILEKQVKDKQLDIAWQNNNIADSAADQGDLQKALLYGNKALDYATASNDNDLKSAVLDSIGNAYYHAENYSQAESYFLKSTALLKGRSKISYGIQNKNLAKAEIKLGKLKEACEHLKISDENYKFIGAEKDLNENKNYKKEANCAP